MSCELGAASGETYQNTSPQVVVLGLFNLESLIEAVLLIIGLRRVVAIGRRGAVVVAALIVAAVVASVVLLWWRLLLLLWLLLPLLPLVVLLLAVLLLAVLLLVVLRLTVLLLAMLLLAIVVIVTHGCGGRVFFVPNGGGALQPGNNRSKQKLACAGAYFKSAPE